MKKKLLPIIIVLVLVLSLSLAACSSTFEVTFTANGKSYPSKKTDSGGKITPPTVTYSAYYSFVGWFEDENAVEPIDFTQPVLTNINAVAKYYDLVQQKNVTTFTAPTAKNLVGASATFGSEGEVMAIYDAPDGYIFVVKGFGGPDHDEGVDPYVLVAVYIGKDSKIKNLTVLNYVGQTEDYTSAITQKALTTAFKDKVAAYDSSFRPGTVAGATLTSSAIARAVRTAAYYGDEQELFTNVEPPKPEDNEYLKILKAAFPATYEVLNTKTVIAKYGEAMLVAKGTYDGKEVIGLVIFANRNTDLLTYADTWPESGVPELQMAIVIDKATNKVIASKITETTNKPEFAVPQAKLDAYTTVVINSKTVFDAFTGGLMTNMGYPTESNPGAGGHGTVVAGTSYIYNGATPDGVYIGQLVRHCFSVAAELYMDYKNK